MKFYINDVDKSDYIYQCDGLEYRTSDLGGYVINEISFQSNLSFQLNDIVKIVNNDNELIDVSYINYVYYNVNINLYEYKSIHLFQYLIDTIYTDNYLTTIDDPDFADEGWWDEYYTITGELPFSLIHKWKYSDSSGESVQNGSFTFGRVRSYRLISMIRYLIYKAVKDKIPTFAYSSVVLNVDKNSRTHFDGEGIEYNLNVLPATYTINDFIGVPLSHIFVHGVRQKIDDKDERRKQLSHADGSTTIVYPWYNNILTDDGISMMDLLNNILIVMGWSINFNGTYSSWTINIDQVDYINDETYNINNDYVTSVDTEIISPFSHAIQENETDQYYPWRNVTYTYPYRGSKKIYVNYLPEWLSQNDCLLEDENGKYYLNNEIDNKKINLLQFSCAVPYKDRNNAGMRYIHSQLGLTTEDGRSLNTLAGSGIVNYLCWNTWTDKSSYSHWAVYPKFHNNLPAASYTSIVTNTRYTITPGTALNPNTNLPYIEDWVKLTTNDKSIIYHGTEWDSPGNKIGYFIYNSFIPMMRWGINNLVIRSDRLNLHSIFDNWPAYNWVKLLKPDKKYTLEIINQSIDNKDLISNNYNISDELNTLEFLKRR